MRCGLFGKLGSKRDFIAVATPRRFLEVWEPWMQASLSASRHQLKGQWQQAFLSAPIWRFWLGADICGTSVAGAVMPSLDAVGRYYPLTLHAIADDNTAIALPDHDAQDAWYESAERFLLATLDPAASFDATTTRLGELDGPALQPPPPAAVARAGNLFGTAAHDGGFAKSLATLRASNPDICAAGTFWWTSGGEHFAAMSLNCRGMPDPYQYSIFLTGQQVGASISADSS